MVQGKAANRVLRKEPPSKGEIKKTDKLSVNDNFVSKLVKVKILSVISKQVFHEFQFLFDFYLGKQSYLYGNLFFSKFRAKLSQNRKKLVIKLMKIDVMR